MKDHEIREAINELRDVAIKYRDAQQLRSRIAGIVHEIIDNVRMHDLKEILNFRESESPEKCESRDKHMRHKCAVRSTADSDFNFMPRPSKEIKKTYDLKVGDEIVITGKKLVYRLNSSRYSSEIIDIFECCGETIYNLRLSESEDIILNKYQDEWEVI